MRAQHHGSVGGNQTRPAGALVVLAGLLGMLGSGCATGPARNPVPEMYSATAIVPGIPGARIWGDEEPPYAQAWLDADEGAIAARFPGIVGRPHHYLALSGGGPFGAFGAGLLNGWTAGGDRPEFTMVTGISAGGLIAPFAFLGPAYDQTLKTVFTQSSTKDIIKPRSLPGILLGDAATDSHPLEELIARHVDHKLMVDIAAEHRRGRLLLIGTANLEAERPVIWNIGTIAASGHPKSLELIRSILLATASIGGAFPPVLVDVEAGGESFDEMHVDGGTVSMVFAYPTGLNWSEVSAKLKVEGAPTLYLVQNFFVDPQWRPVKSKTAHIAAHAMFSMIRNQGIGDVYRIYAQAQRDGVDFNLAHIPADFDEKPEEIFDPVFMSKLFDEGFRLGEAGYPWEKVPPGMETD